jgi:hypothetical protein
MTTITQAKISDVKANPNNPRLIKDDKFDKLVKSIKDFPEMLQIRPIVVNSDMVVLGGNMRLKACKEAGLKEIPIIRADQLTEDQQREFIIKDNVGFGEWDWDVLANEWDLVSLGDWGVSEVTAFAVPTDQEREIDLSVMAKSADSYLNNTIRQIVLHYDIETHADVLTRLSVVGKAFDIEDDNSSVVLALLEFWERKK